MKDKNEVIQEFKELVNMTAKELKEWLKGDESTGAGWPKNDESGESIGHDSGRQIVEILESNPEKDPEKYTDDQVGHMRKVVSYCKRHLAQEEKANNEKPIEEVKKTKSYASLKNWGHDPIKKREANGGGAEGEEEDEKEGEEEGKEEEKEEKAGEKRKAPDDQSGKSKKRETDTGPAEVKDDEKEEEAEAQEDVSNEKETTKEQQNGKDAGNGDGAKGPKEGEKVSWNWGQGQPEGTVKEVNPEEIEPSIRLRRAIHAGDALLVKRILKSHPALLHNPDTSPVGLSNSNMHLAASLGHKEVCQVLLDAGHEDPCPALNENHQTALMLASGAGHTEVVHLLCENDTNCILRRDIRGRDAVMEASVGGHDTILQLLLTYVPGGPYEAVQRADADGNTALHFASGNGNLLGLRTLLAAGADVERRNIWNWTPGAYSATVQAEVYLKGLVSELERLQQQQQKRRKEAEAAKKMVVGTVRVVRDNGDEDERAYEL
ncbi:spherulin-1b precursor [Trichoderma arundinaceum]|uniref:Spherulin-1b n=1 Tax=Trichoderma arundinaceum TaxID=490622 RepID=A0A395NRJ8_TRIAR|nr:spherulin-1b precursor [Trichoderma arundinaceum]